jgi:hypothetical protein
MREALPGANEGLESSRRAISNEWVPRGLYASSPRLMPMMW